MDVGANFGYFSLMGADLVSPTGHGLRLHRLRSGGWPKEITTEAAMQSIDGSHIDLFFAR